MSDLTDREKAVKLAEIIKDLSPESFGKGSLKVTTKAETLADGTLHITVDTDISDIDRILLSQFGTHRGELYYVDAQPERKKGNDAQTKKGAESE